MSTVNDDVSISQLIKNCEQGLISEYQKIVKYFSPDGKYKYENDWKNGIDSCSQAILNCNQMILELSGRLGRCFTIEEQDKVKQLCVRTKLFSNYFKAEKECAEKPSPYWLRMAALSALGLSVGSTAIAALGMAAAVYIPDTTKNLLDTRVSGIWFLASAVSTYMSHWSYSTLQERLRKREGQRQNLDQLIYLMQKPA